MTDDTPKPEKKLTPANQNPWYILMTLHGEQPEGARWWNYDEELHAKNRRDWNKWAARGLSAERLAELRAMTDGAGKPRFDPDELIPHNDKEFAALAAAFKKASDQRGATADLPMPDQVCDLLGVMFDRPFIARGLLFPDYTKLSGATFAGDANLAGVIFSGTADLLGATFSRGAFMKGATFADDAHLLHVTFSSDTDLSGATFSRLADLSGSRFSGNAFLSSVTFSLAAFLSGTIFSRFADLSGARFSGIAVLSNVTFSRLANFSGATFSGSAILSGATFSGDANLSGATFSRNADLSGVKFSRKHKVDFSHATFKGETTFLNAEMEGATSFAHAVFEKHPPSFHGAKLNEGMALHGVRWPDPPTPQTPPPEKDSAKARDAIAKAESEAEAEAKEAAQSHVYNYQRLKQIMEGLKKHEDELNFFAMEMVAQRVVDGGWRSPRGLLNGIYDAASDYGRSIARPAWHLLVVAFLCFVFLAGSDECRNGSCAPIQGGKALALSLTSALGFLPLKKEIFGDLSSLSTMAHVWMATETVLSFALLFLIGLGLRNRFRMK